MKGYLAKDFYGTNVYIEPPKVIMLRNDRNMEVPCWSGKVYDFSTEINKEVQRLGESLVENKEVKEVEIEINIKVL